MHLHKCGGTYLVNHARNNAILPEEESNGNPMKDGQPLAFWEWRPDAQMEFISNFGHTFLANEYCVGEYFLIDPDIKYITVLRDPLDRAYSHFRHEVQGYKAGADDAHYYGELFATKGFAWFCENLLYEVPWANNYMTKQLGISNEKKYACADDLRLAMVRLKFFAVVGIFEQLSSRADIMDPFGWAPSTDAFHPPRQGSSARNALADNQTALEALLEAHKLDLELYEIYAQGRS